MRLVHRPGGTLASRARRVGIDGVLGRLDRVGSWTSVPGEAAEDGLTWDERDAQTRRWFPQGITTRFDPTGDDADGRRVLLTSWYGHGALGYAVLGSRISVVDLAAEDAPRYAHVRLVDERRVAGLRGLTRVPVHAGGLAWYGPHLFVAASGGGLRVFRVADVERLRLRSGSWLRGRGTRHVLPQAGAYASEQDEGPRMTYSFLSVERGVDVDHLVAGEYGRKDRTGRHRLLRFALDRETGLLATDADGRAHPVEAGEGVPRMQGATVVDGTWFVTASAGEGNPGDLWVGRPGALERHRGVLPTGPEDITSWPGTDRLWSLTEWPGRRWVYAVDAGAWVGRR
ncbi:hypothetical protein [Aeromicrobium alkaliterrae]|uniref:Uncharacterized protein n=1 Tax=Aeromicrobium alkaliterrae TaxID=302168 RepID=A0ABN2JQF8_9ACTN